MVNDPSKQKHHYVPQFFFKLFESKGHVEVYEIAERRFHPGSCKDLSFIRNFYEDPEIERAFSLVDKASSDLWKLINKKDFSILTIEEKVNILRFLVFQHTRTPNAKKKYERFFDFIMDELVRDLFRRNVGKCFINNDGTKFVFTKEWVESGVMPKIKGPAFIHVLFNSLIIGPYYIADLVPVILINKTGSDFVFSDDPVIFYNSFFNYVHDLDMTYFFSPGLQIFCPLDSKIMLMLFDPKFYDAQGMSIFNDVQGLPTGKINITNKSDIDNLNMLQLINCKKSIYYADKNQSTYIEGLHKSLDAYTDFKTHEMCIAPCEEKYSKGYKEFSEFYIEGQAGYQLHLTFMPFMSRPGATETIGTYGFPTRSTQLMAIIEDVIKDIYKKNGIEIQE